jgi:hypothetical protein
MLQPIVSTNHQVDVVSSSLFSKRDRRPVSNRTAPVAESAPAPAPPKKPIVPEEAPADMADLPMPRVSLGEPSDMGFEARRDMEDAIASTKKRILQRLQDTSADAPPPTLKPSHVSTRLPSMFGPDALAIRNIVKHWAQPVVMVQGEPVESIFQKAAEEVANDWPHVMILLCPNAPFAMTAKVSGSENFADAEKSALRRVARLDDAIDILQRLCLEASLCNRIDTADRADVPPESLLLVVDPSNWRSDAVMVKRWFQKQRTQLLFTASLQQPWAARHFQISGVFRSTSSGGWKKEAIGQP